MSEPFKTDQEKFWAGEFGKEYIKRNESTELLASNLNFFSKSLCSCNGIQSAIEFGSNVGMNIRALKLLFPNSSFSAVEINKDAYDELITIEGIKGFNQSIFDYNDTVQYDLSFIKGVLIHLNPEMLPMAYSKLYEASKKYILIAEYYNPSPVAVSYRGHSDRLFKRDFAGEFMEQYPDTQLINYGFAYKRDPLFPQDDITWFLMMKK